MEESKPKFESMEISQPVVVSSPKRNLCCCCCKLKLCDLKIFNYYCINNYNIINFWDMFYLSS